MDDIEYFIKVNKAAERVNQEYEVNDLHLKYLRLIHKVYDNNLKYDKDSKAIIKSKEKIKAQSDKCLCDLLNELGYQEVVSFYEFINK